MVPEQVLLSLAIAGAIGLLIGLERGWEEREAGEGKRVAGLRTFGLIGLFGGVCALLSERTGSLLLPGVALAGLTAVLIVSHRQAYRVTGDLGITTLCAALLTFVLGLGAAQGFRVEAAATAVVVALLLGSKPTLHRWVRAMGSRELRAALKLLVLSVVILPVLPDKGYGPWKALNPYEIWWMVVLIATISFVGYVAVRVVGPRRGIVVTGLLGGLVSSTALTLHLSRRARQGADPPAHLAGGILLACGTMFPRVLIVAGILHWPLVGALWPSLLLMGALTYGGGLAWTLAVSRAGESGPAEGARLRNPLELAPALFFGAVLAVVLLAGAGLEETFGGAGLLSLAAVSGLTDVDAITLTLARMSEPAGEEAVVGLPLAALGIVLASATNGLTKTVLSLSVGGWAVGWRVALPLLSSAGLGLLLAILLA